MAEAQIEADWARCYARALLERFGVERLNSDEELVGSPEFMEAATDASQRCMSVSRD